MKNKYDVCQNIVKNDIKNDFKTNRKFIRILEYCYANSNNDHLGVLLGELDCRVCADGMPADIATHYDWINVKKTYASKDLFTQVMLFLVSYEEKYDFDFESAKKILEDIRHSSRDISELEI